MIEVQRSRGNLTRFEARKMGVDQIIYGFLRQIKDFDHFPEKAGKSVKRSDMTIEFLKIILAIMKE